MIEHFKKHSKQIKGEFLVVVVVWSIIAFFMFLQTLDPVHFEWTKWDVKISLLVPTLLILPFFVLRLIFHVKIGLLGNNEFAVNIGEIILYLSFLVVPIGGCFSMGLKGLGLIIPYGLFMNYWILPFVRGSEALD